MITLSYAVLSQVDDRLLELLQKLGMREYDARVYITLVRSSKITASDIYSMTGIPRNRIYDTLEDLQRRGFVEVRHGRPMMYQAVPPESAVRRIKEEWIQTIESSASEALQRFQKLYIEKSEERFAEFEFWSIKSLSGVFERALEVIKHARTFVLIEGYPENLLRSLMPTIYEANRRGVKIYVVVSSIIQDKELQNSLERIGTVKMVEQSLFKNIISDDEAVFSLSSGEAVYARAPFLIQGFAKMLMEKFGLASH